MRIQFILTILVLSPSLLLGQFGKPGIGKPSDERRLSDAIGTSPTLSQVELALLEKVDVLIGTNLSHAQAMLEALVFGENPSSAYFDYALAVVYMTDRKNQKAEDQFLRAIEKFPDFKKAWVDLGTLRYYADDTVGAVETLSKAVELGAADANTLGILAFCHLKQGNFMAADAAYDSALLMEPTNLNWLEGKTFILVESKQYAEASIALRALIKRDPMNADYWLLQSNTYLALKQPLKAARNIEIVRSMGEADAEAVLLLANIYMQQEIYDRATETYIKALEMREGKDSLLALKVANQLFQRGQFEKAKVLFSAIGDDRTDWELEDMTRYGYLQAEFAVLGEREELAIKILNAVLEVDPFNGKCLTKLAELYARNDEKDKAYYVLERVQGGSDFEFNALLFHSRLLIEDERYAKSLKILDRALKIHPSAPLEIFYERVKVAAAHFDDTI